MTVRRPHPDLIAVLVLAALWLLFFWRLFTPNPADQAALARGDFSGQFVAFAGYQYARLSQGEVPLWNPYNNGGLPFIADPQAAVFYPPRLATIGLSSLSGGWTYHALELEMTAHVLAYTLFMYAFVRRLTLQQAGSVLAALVAAIIAGYSGFTAGYPPLQLALLEAAIWLPLALLGILEATREGRALRPLWLVLAGIALGLSWMAGHPQTSYFLTLLMIAYYVYRCYARRFRWALVLGGIALFGVVSFGMAAVQLLPGFEYLLRTARTGFGFDAKGNGFPLQDILQFLFPGIVSVFSPLFVGVTGLVLALVAIWRRASESRFWGVVALLALLWSFGANAPLYALLYNVLPGLQPFRGQERAAYLVMNSLAILAGLGIVRLANWDILGQHAQTLRLRVWLNRLFIACLIFAALVFVAWLGNPADYGSVIGPVVLSTVVVGLLFLILPSLLTEDRSHARWLLVPILVFELFTVSMDADAVYDPVPPGQQLSMTPPPLLEPVVYRGGEPYRVDGLRGVHDNFGSLYAIPDMRGISPLFLSGPFSLIEPDAINPAAWELFAVRYIFTDWQELPVPGTVIATGEDRYGPVNLHKLASPRPFAHLLASVEVIPDNAAALARAKDPSFNARQTVILDRTPEVALGAGELTGSATVTEFVPESFTVEVTTSENAVLSLAHPHYPGWQATLDAQPVETYRAYGALTAVAVPAGEHTLRLVYDPLSFRVGALFSLVTWLTLGILALMIAVRTIQSRRAEV